MNNFLVRIFSQKYGFLCQKCVYMTLQCPVQSNDRKKLNISYNIPLIINVTFERQKRGANFYFY